MRILLVEDDNLVAQAVQKRLQHERYTVEWADNGLDALEAVQMGGFSLVILDLGLPEMDGLEVLSSMRKAGITLPAIALTARDSVNDRIKGLDHGADDYMVKPFDMDELVARCRALLRRSSGRADNLLICGEITLNAQAHTVHVSQKPVVITAHEFSVLQLLMEARGRVVTKAQIEEMLYGWSEGVESNTIEVYISQLRKKVGQEHIKTLRGVGYMIP